MNDDNCRCCCKLHIAAAGGASSLLNRMWQPSRRKNDDNIETNFAYRQVLSSSILNFCMIYSMDGMGAFTVTHILNLSPLRHRLKHCSQTFSMFTFVCEFVKICLRCKPLSPLRLYLLISIHNIGSVAFLTAGHILATYCCNCRHVTSNFLWE